MIQETTHFSRSRDLSRYESICWREFRSVSLDLSKVNCKFCLKKFYGYKPFPYLVWDAVWYNWYYSKVVSINVDKSTVILDSFPVCTIPIEDIRSIDTAEFLLYFRK